MSAPQIAGLLAAFAFALLILSAVLGSALADRFSSLYLARRECFPWVFFPRMRRRRLWFHTRHAVVRPG
jgi:hypothetical protein